jgi:hypothetical protein
MAPGCQLCARDARRQVNAVRAMALDVSAADEILERCIGRKSRKRPVGAENSSGHSEQAFRMT